MSEKNLDQFLRENKPAVSDDPAFLMETRRRLSAVEGIKNEMDRQRRSGRFVLLLTFLTGLTVGALVVAFFYLYPADLADIEDGLFAGLHRLLESKKYLMLLPVAISVPLGLLLGRK